MQSAGSTVTCSQVAGSISMRPSGAGLHVETFGCILAMLALHLLSSHDVT